MKDEAAYLETENEADRRRGVWQAPRRVLGVLASPRGTRGATGKFYAALAEGMEQAGAAVATVQLAELAPQPCSGCFGCWFRGGRRCVLTDPMSDFVETVPEFDLLILATPLFVDGMTGLAKNFVDRLMPLNHPSIARRNDRFIHPCRHRRMPDLVLLAVCGLPGVANFGPLLAHVASLAEHMHTPLAAALLRPETLSMRHRLAKSGLEGALAATREAGQSLVRSGKVAEGLLAKIREPLLSGEDFSANAAGWWK